MAASIPRAGLSLSVLVRLVPTTVDLVAPLVIELGEEEAVAQAKAQAGRRVAIVRRVVVTVRRGQINLAVPKPRGSLGPVVIAVRRVPVVIVRHVPVVIVGPPGRDRPPAVVVAGMSPLSQRRRRRRLLRRISRRLLRRLLRRISSRPLSRLLQPPIPRRLRPARNRVSPHLAHGRERA